MKPIYVFGLTLAIIIGIIAIERCNGADMDSDNPDIARVKNDRYGDLLKVKGGNNNSIFKEYCGFEVLFNPVNKTPDYVAWELIESETSGDNKRTNSFWQDTDIKGCPSPSDYSRSGYDRGHLCPAADMKWSPEAMKHCFAMSNMTPQDHALNGYAWASLENKCRDWALRDSALVIVAGPIYQKGDNATIGTAKVHVPSAFFKVILAPYLKEPRAIGFIYPNQSAPGKMENYAMSVRDVEKITGLDFFFNLPDSIENAVETDSRIKQWFHSISSRP